MRVEAWFCLFDGGVSRPSSLSSYTAVAEELMEMVEIPLADFGQLEA